MRLTVRLVLSHMLVAVIGGVATFFVVRWLAPAIFDQTIKGMGMGWGAATGRTLREQLGSAVNQALLVGTVLGILAAAGFGIFAAYRVLKPLRGVRSAARALASGNYGVPVPAPREPELGALAEDVNTLARGLAETEARRMRLRGEVAHELRTPLTVIDGYIEAMIDGVLPTTPENLNQIEDETRRLRRLGDDLSALSKAEEGRIGLQPRACDLGRLASSAAERLRPQAQDAGIELQVVPAPADVEVLVDPDRVAQIVTNLIGNSLRSTPAGGTIKVETHRRGSAGLVVVSDTGIGIDFDDQERVFERFYRAAGRAADSGSGIGLTISRGIARSHGGDVTCSSPGLGKGATFTLRIPLSP